ncbi:MAG: GTP cyclohydrolase I FolE [Elusimicrobiota bacterium]|jgi:GTP cyclohydrolase I|nr:GTP cyclohydrolase I FolE [Elusimicrobiota bacterium]
MKNKKIKSIDQEAIKKAIKDIIIALGENPDREGLSETPDRVARMYTELCKGYSQNPKEIIKIFYEEDSYEEIILVKDIPIYSLCEHHLIPFFGKAHVAYIPKKGKITGLSKIARTVDIFARRLQLQERLTKQIVDAIDKIITPKGVMVVLEAEHLCMTMRGVNKAGSKSITSSMRGIFLSDARTRAEAMALIK